MSCASSLLLGVATCCELLPSLSQGIPVDGGLSSSAAQSVQVKAAVNVINIEKKAKIKYFEAMAAVFAGAMTAKVDEMENEMDDVYLIWLSRPTRSRWLADGHKRGG